MASVHIDEVRSWKAQQGDRDALPGPGGVFFEIRFDVEGLTPEVVDADFVKQVLTVDSPQGVVTISFDANGWLKALDIS